MATAAEGTMRERAPARRHCGVGVSGVRAIRTIEELERMRDAWRELLEESPADRLFTTWEWLYTWWKHLGKDAALEVAAVEGDGRILAFAPLLRRPPRAPMDGPRLEFLGGGHVGSDYLDLVARRGREEAVLDALVPFLARGEAALSLDRVPEDGLTLRLAERLRERGYSVSLEPAGICPVISLAGLTFSDYLRSLGPSHRYNFRRRLRQVNGRYRLHMEEVRTDTARRRALAILVSLHHLRWRERGGSDAFHTPALVRFHQEVSGLALARGWLRLYVLWLDGIPAAALYGFLYRGIFYFYQSGFDPAYRRQSVGLVLLGLSIQRAIGEGAREFDLLHGDEGYKFLWTRDARALARLEIYPPGARGILARGRRSLGRGMRRTARFLLPRTVVTRLAGPGAWEPWEALDAAQRP